MPDEASDEGRWLTLERALRNELVVARRMATLLDQEAQVLLGGSPENVLSVATTKSEYGTQLARLAEECVAAVEALGGSHLREIIVEAPRPQRRVLALLHGQLLRVLATIQERNNANAGALEAASNFCRELTDLLVRPGEPAAYGPNGEQRVQAQRGPLVDVKG